jgi:hypothetical protein
MSHLPRYNRLKQRALSVFECHGGWIRPTEWAVLVGFYPIRAAYSYLLRLHRFGLLERFKTTAGIVYRLSERGAGRLEWLTNVAKTRAASVPRRR